MRRFAKEKLGCNKLVLSTGRSRHLDGSDSKLQGGTPHGPPAPHPEHDPEEPTQGYVGEIYVDGTTMITWAGGFFRADPWALPRPLPGGEERSVSTLPGIASGISGEWARIVTEELGLSSSKENVFVGGKPLARAAVAACERFGFKASIKSHGKDLGCDAGGGMARHTSVLDKRAINASSRGERLRLVVTEVATQDTATKRMLAQARTISITQIKPCQTYSVATAGPSPALDKKHRSNIANGAGLLEVGASATAAIERAFGAAAHPDIHNDTSCVRAWLRVCETIEMQSEAISLAWITRLAEIKPAK